MTVLVTAAGFQTTVQDCGRVGWRPFGVTPGGALDAATLRLANLLVGNDETAAGLEIASGRVQLRFCDERLIAWGGGRFKVKIARDSSPPLRCACVAPGESCEILATHGRAWLAVSGGIDVPLVLGSRATDLRARFGGFNGRALRDGDELPLGARTQSELRIAAQITGRLANWTGPYSSPAAPERMTTLRTIRGQHWTAEAGAKLLEGNFRVAINSDRMGLRLEGKTIPRTHAGMLVSQPVTPGTIQLPTNGAPIVLLADCQTIGGYPRLAHVISVDLARAAQLQPMDYVRFELTTLGFAQQLARQREREIAIFRAGIRTRFA
ncbi:MAG: biotin-dependent carboxyltransferase family protein [Verrucomicrobia bacterium]|nr:biotin-dependent carboxyltransferase family protein [Verrucomicrobiota bacterium]